jgi:glycosyltransferase involved in cell wall biosynthesis
MDQVKQLPCAKIVLTQSYSYMLETLQPGQTWSQFGFMKCITTNNKQKEYIEKVMRSCSFDILEPYISEVFTPKLLPAMPIIGIHTKDQSDAVNLIKTFYLRFPQYRWFTFRDLRGLSEVEFANSLKDCFVSVWVDNESGFGTFPLESMKSNVPVIGKVPDLPPTWMNEDNGIWITDHTLLADVISDFIQNWLEDNIKPELYDEMKKTSEQFSDKQKFESSVVSLFENYLNTRADAFEQQITKTEE